MKVCVGCGASIMPTRRVLVWSAAKSGIARFLLPAFIFPLAAIAQPAPEPALIPLPAHMETGEGQLKIDSSFTVTLTGYTEPRLVEAKDRFLATLMRETGIPFTQAGTTQHTTLTIQAAGASKS